MAIAWDIQTFAKAVILEGSVLRVLYILGPIVPLSRTTYTIVGIAVPGMRKLNLDG